MQGATLDYVALDEEPPYDIYSECLTRTNATGGLVWMTFTPLQGVSEVVRRFMYEKSPDRAIISMTIDDCDHFSEEQKKQIIASYQPFELEADKSAAFPRWEAGAYSRLPPRALAATTARYRTTGLVLVEWISAGRITSQLAS